jgi:hypothetical protein
VVNLRQTYSREQQQQRRAWCSLWPLALKYFQTPGFTIPLKNSVRALATFRKFLNCLTGAVIVLIFSTNNQYFGPFCMSSNNCYLFKNMFKSYMQLNLVGTTQVFAKDQLPKLKILAGSDWRMTVGKPEFLRRIKLVGIQPA